MPNGLVHGQTYDNASRKQTEQLTGAGNAVTRNFTYTYYPSGATGATAAYVGLPWTVSDPRGVTFTVTNYDAFLRPQTVTASGGSPQQNQTTTYGYDTLNRLKSVAQNFASPTTGPPTLVSRNYDGYGHIQSETVSINGVVQSQFNQTWDGAGNRASLANTLAPQGVGAGLVTSYSHWADGLLQQTSVAGNSFAFNFDTNALLTSRQNGWRTQAVTQRDALGRVLGQQSALGGGAPFSESQTWSGKDTRLNYTANRTGTGVWNETRGYAYNGRQQLIYESDAPAAGGYADFLYRFDNESLAAIPPGAGLGVRTNALRRNAVTDSNYEPGSWWVGFLLPNSTFGPGQDAWQRPVYEGPFAGQANLFYQLQVAYDGVGNVTGRTLANGNQQTLYWDAFGRLVQVTEADAAGANGYQWTAVYDGLGRRLRTFTQTLSNHVVSSTGLTLDSYYDPQVEFLELGVAVNGARTWNIYGPDLNGRYGALQGVGGLEATINESTGTVTPVVSDSFGNVVGTVSGGTMNWNPARVGSYGVLPGSTAPVLDGATVTLAQATLWRGRRIDPTGLYYMGARYYDPNSGRFLSADPLGHGASMDLYSYCGGDPNNGLDPTGRCATAQELFNDSHVVGSDCNFKGMGILTDYIAGRQSVRINAGITPYSSNVVALAKQLGQARVNAMNHSMELYYNAHPDARLASLLATAQNSAEMSNLSSANQATGFFGKLFGANTTYRAGLDGDGNITLYETPGWVNGGLNFFKTAAVVATTEIGGSVVGALMEGPTAAITLSGGEVTIVGRGALSIGGEAASTELSVIRFTQPGETFIRYETTAVSFSHITPNGVTPKTYAAPISDGFVPLELRASTYNLPEPQLLRLNVFILRPPPGTLIIGPRSAAGGTGMEVLFPHGF
jgi:RHS repeat-associated protein